MAKRYLTVVAQTHAGGSIAPAMTAYDTEAEALSAFHTELAYALVSDAVVADAAFVLTTDGEVLYAQRVEGLAKPAPDGAGA